MKSTYRFYIRPKLDYRSRVAPYEVAHWAYSIEGAKHHARKLNLELSHTEIWRIEEVSSGETEYL